MLRILGSPKIFCDGITRRDSMLVGGLSLFGLGLADQFRIAQLTANDSAKRDASFGRAKACILLYLYGSPSQLEFADMKPDAPVEVRGELKGIRSTLPGCDVCELLPHTARIMDRVTVVRSLNHPHPIHGVAYATTGIPNIDAPMELSPHDAKHWPFVGSVVAHTLAKHSPKRLMQAIPDNVALPFPFSSRRTGEVQRAGPYAAYLGNAWNPHFTDFHGEITGRITKTLREDKAEFAEPYVGISTSAGFSLGGNRASENADVTLDRLQTRHSLLDQLETARRRQDRNGFDGDRHRQMAWNLLGSPRGREALAIQREAAKTRESYGMTVFGQGALAARRLVEAGSKFVTVFWDEYGFAGSGWDTHWEHYPRMKNELMPGFDRGFSGLIADLDQRGMLDETLVVVLSEHGRTPKINTSNGGGRDHWSQAYSSLIAGGGIARGRVVGKTDRIGGTVTDRPVSPKDMLATMYHLLGIDLETTLTDRTGRPQSIVPGGEVVREMLA